MLWETDPHINKHRMEDVTKTSPDPRVCLTRAGILCETFEIRRDAMLRDSRTIVAHLRDELLALITRERLKSGDRIPTEAELTQAFGVSRPALREALKLLEQDNVIRVEHGRGRFVSSAGQLRLNQAITHFESVTDLMRSFGYEPTNRVLSVSDVPADADIADALRCPEGAPTIRLERLRSHAERVLIYSCDHFRRELIPGSLDAVDWTGSLFEIFGGFGIAPRMSIATASALTLPEAIRTRPELVDFGPALLIAETCFTERAHPVIFARDYHRGDAFTFSFVRK